MKITDLNPQDYPEYYELYLSAVPRDMELLAAFKEHGEEVVAFFDRIPEQRWKYRYAKGKWSVSEVLQHIIDTERIFVHRCFRIARGEKTNMSGFDQDQYIATANADLKTPKALIAEYAITRAYSLSVLNALTDEELLRKGLANECPLSAGAAAFIVLGHEIWHNRIISERYLS